MMPYTTQHVNALPNLTLRLSWAAGGQADVQLADVIGHTSIESLFFVSREAGVVSREIYFVFHY